MTARTPAGASCADNYYCDYFVACGAASYDQIRISPTILAVQGTVDLPEASTTTERLRAALAGASHDQLEARAVEEGMVRLTAQALSLAHRRDIARRSVSRAPGVRRAASQPPIWGM